MNLSIAPEALPRSFFIHTFERLHPHVVARLNSHLKLNPIDLESTLETVIKDQPKEQQKSSLRELFVRYHHPSLYEVLFGGFISRQCPEVYEDNEFIADAAIRVHVDSVNVINFVSHAAPTIALRHLDTITRIELESMSDGPTSQAALYFKDIINGVSTVSNRFRSKGVIPTDEEKKYEESIFGMLADALENLHHQNRINEQSLGNSRAWIEGLVRSTSMLILSNAHILPTVRPFIKALSLYAPQETAEMFDTAKTMLPKLDALRELSYLMTYQYQKAVDSRSTDDAYVYPAFNVFQRIFGELTKEQQDEAVGLIKLFFFGLQLYFTLLKENNSRFTNVRWLNGISRSVQDVPEKLQSLVNPLLPLIQSKGLMRFLKKTLIIIKRLISPFFLEALVFFLTLIRNLKV